MCKVFSKASNCKSKGHLIGKHTTLLKIMSC
uniref:Uncharacterized protein n=1 Tax=Rhizophora mucronata TaxID=61149 RepID=A0A2P2NPE8_RHIMU